MRRGNAPRGPVTPFVIRRGVTGCDMVGLGWQAVEDEAR